MVVSGLPYFCMRRLRQPRLAYGICYRCSCPWCNGCSVSPFFFFSTTSSLIPLCAVFQSLCSSFATVLFLFLAVLFRGAFHREDHFPALLSTPFLSYLVLKPLSESSPFPLGGGACGVVRDLLNFPLSRSSSSCIPTFLKISIYSSSVANEKWDRRHNIS